MLELLTKRRKIGGPSEDFFSIANPVDNYRSLFYLVTDVFKGIRTRTRSDIVIRWQFVEFERRPIGYNRHSTSCSSPATRATSFLNVRIVHGDVATIRCKQRNNIYIYILSHARLGKSVERENTLCSSFIVEWGRIENEARQVPGEVGQNPVTLYTLTCIDIYYLLYIQGPESPHYDTRFRERERKREGGREKSGCFLYGLIVRPSSCCHGAYRSEVWDGLRSMVGERETGGKRREIERKEFGIDRSEVPAHARV